MSALSIRPDSCDLDLLSLGALVHRLDPGVIPFRKARAVEVHVSGGEYKAAGAVVSFDLNYRAKLWASAGGSEKARQVLRRTVGQVDALIGNEEDLQKGLGIAGPDVAAKSGLDPETFFQMIDRVVTEFPN